MKGLRAGDFQSSNCPNMFSFSIFDIPVRVQPFFWLTMVILSGGFQGGGDSKEALLSIVVFTIAGFISILVHELGHALTAKHFGKKVEIVLQAFGGYAAYSGGAPLSRRRTFMVTAAGPALQIVLGLAAIAFKMSVQITNPALNGFLNDLILISIFWALLNLLPILPLDGGRLLQTVLGPRHLRTTLIISLVVGALVAIGSLLAFGRGGIFMAIFCGMFAYQSFKALQQPSWR